MTRPDCYIGIDPGTTGGISAIDKTGLRTYPIPKNLMDAANLLQRLRAEHRQTEVFIERVGLYRDDKNTPGKSFYLVKMIVNFEFCKQALCLSDMDFTSVESRTWQRGLHLYATGETRTVRKNRFKAYARSVYPESHITLQTADSVCLAIYAYKKTKERLGF